MGHWWSKAVPWAVAVILLSPQVGRAAGLLEDQVNLSSVISVGCTDPETCDEQSTSTTTELYSQGVDTFTARLGLNVNAAASPVGRALENGLATYAVGFTVRSGGDYQLRIRVRRAGALRRSHALLFCTGAVVLTPMAPPTATFNDDPPAEVPELALPGATIDAGFFDFDQAVPDTVGERVLSVTNRDPGPDHYVFNFTMGAVADSNPCPVSARLGADNGSTSVCPACEYPGDPSRVISEDGLFVEVTVLDHCGNGVTEDPEQCDLGGQNGPTSCCSSDCTFRGVDRVCRVANGPCDQSDLCKADSAECPDRKQAAGFPCPDDGDACTVDQCNAAGACVHLLNGSLCPDRLCGNSQVDPGEACDLGPANGAEGNCCAADCKLRSQGTQCRPSTDPCDPAESCNGANPACPDVKSPADSECPDEGDFCTQDRCDAGGHCTHTLKPELCPNLFCGNGQLDTGEECDLGDLLNGQPTSCCTANCKKQADNSPCSDGVFCNVNDRCTNGVCTGSGGNPCSPLGSCAICDEANDRCDESFCASLCGNSELDGTEDCDLGTELNGAPSNCCGTNCKFRPNNSACTNQLFCDGAEHCTAGVCGGSAGTPCSRTCAVCNENNDVCDEATCPTTLLPDQPTRALLIGEIFDGDGERYDTSAGGSVRGTLDLDANADLRFTAADLGRLPRCADDAVLVGGVCIDKYEASVVENPPGSPTEGTQYGISAADYPCEADGSDCANAMFALSRPGSPPSAHITWFQAQQACASVGKRLLTNAEWQMAVAGTPDLGEGDNSITSCNTISDRANAVYTGSRSACVSKWGIYDMVGNVWEWVAEWMPASSACPGWDTFSDDAMCLAGTNTSANFPGAVIRGGSYKFGAQTGPLAIQATTGPVTTVALIGFRCARAPF